MFDKAENILFNSQIYYYFAKLNGLNSIVYKRNPLSATSTYFSRFANQIVSTIWFSAIIFGQYEIMKVVFKNNNKFVVGIIYVITLIVDVCNMSLIYFNQIFSHQSHLKFINQAIEVYQQFLRFMSMDCKQFFDRFFLRSYVIRVIISVLQISVCAIIIYRISKRVPRVSQHVVRSLSLAYLVVYGAIVRSILICFYYCSLLLVLQFYRKINFNLELLTDKIEANNKTKNSNRKLEIYLKISDELDLLCILIISADDLLNTVKKVFGIHILWAALESYVNILSFVIFFYFF